MSLLRDNVLWIVGILLVLIILEGLIIFVQYKKRKKKHKGGSSSTVSRERYNEVAEKLNTSRSDVNQLKVKYSKVEKENKELFIKHSRVEEGYKKACLEIPSLKQTIDDLEENKKNLEQKIRELTRDNDELSKLAGKEPAPIVAETTVATSTPIISKSESKEETANNAVTNSSQPPVQNDASPEVTQETKAPKADTKVEPSKEEPKNEIPKEEPKVDSTKEKLMYASFPRSAGSNIYFSDLSENWVDDSYFELKISFASGKATFKPLDFMKIRNYDPAMAAMLTEGVKPNIASTVIGIEPGKAHIEGKDWIIDNLAKIKLA